MADYYIVFARSARKELESLSAKLVQRIFKTLWYTGKATGTIGKISPGGKVEKFDLPTAGSVPIYIKAGPGASTR